MKETCPKCEYPARFIYQGRSFDGLFEQWWSCDVCHVKYFTLKYVGNRKKKIVKVLDLARFREVQKLFFDSVK